jgi:glyoxylase-like metal-dependent hydrolase (beta-lactamase superfamily II)
VGSRVMEGISSTLRVGEVEVTRVEELVLPTAMWWLLPDAPEDAVDQHREWMAPFVNERGHILQSIHTFVVKADGLTILVDTGVGNHKQRDGSIPAFHMLDTNYLERLAAAGAAPDEVDLVLITHMHTDHCGWNTTLVDGVWQPTFANARTLFVQREWEYWASFDERSGEGTLLVEDSLRPVEEAGLADLVEADHAVSPSVRLEPSHGHTPGHVCVRISSGGDEAVITGDVMHSPIQCAYPDPQPRLDNDAEPARLARRSFLERYADSGVTVLGTHFGGPTAGRISAEGDAYRFDAVEGF